MPYFLALDAGGTKTQCVLADDTRELARARTGTIKLLRVGPEEARANLDSGLAQLAALSGLDLQSVTRTCVGTSGASVPLVADWIRTALTQRTGGDVLVCGDEEIALDAAFQGGGGVLVIAGTGCNIAGRTRDGRITSAGGWGPVLGDYGSGFWIGHEGLRRAFRALDEGIPTILIDRVQLFWNQPSLAGVVQHANSPTAPNLSQLAQVVAECAAEGDAVSQQVLHSAGQELAYLVQLVIERLRGLEADAFQVPQVAITGSVLARIAPVRQSLTDSLRNAYPGIHVQQEAVDPVLGALWRARRGRSG